MTRYIPNTLRKLVAERANHRCEYCRVPAEDALFPFHIDHIVSIKHGGKTSAENLAYACQICNANKGTDIATFLNDLTIPVRLFNPRLDNWSDHFEANSNGVLLAKTPVAAATIKILDLNHPESIIERRALIKFGIFP